VACGRTRASTSGYWYWRRRAPLEVTRPNGAVETVPLVDGVGSIQVPEHQRVQLRALNAAGAQVGTGAGPIGESQSTGDQSSPPTVDNWS